MKFLYPEFLWAFFAISVPIVIHLFNFRKFKQVYFSNIELLKQVQIETKSKSHLKHIVLLIIRIMVISLLVLAFSQPYIPISSSKTSLNENISVYIDNSHSMDTKGENGYLLELAKAQAIQMAKEFKPGDKFQLLTNEFYGYQQRFMNKEEFIKMVEEIKPSFKIRKLNQVAKRQSEALKLVSGNKRVFWLSDFQLNTSNFSEVKMDSTIGLSMIPYTQNQKGNIYIDSVWFETPLRKLHSEEKLFAKIKNRSNAALEFKLELKINDVIEGFTNKRINPAASVVAELQFTNNTTGFKNAVLSLEDYPDPEMIFDDSFYFSFDIKEKIKVLHLHQSSTPIDSNSYLGKIFHNQDNTSYESYDLGQFNYATLGNYECIFLTDARQLSTGLVTELENYVKNGGTLGLILPESIEITGYNEFLGNFGCKINKIDSSGLKVGKIALDNPLYQEIFEKIPENLDLPVVNKYYNISFFNHSGNESLLSLLNGNQFLSKLNKENGYLYLLAAPLSKSWTNFTQHALFVASFLRIAEFSLPRIPGYYQIGKDEKIILNRQLPSQQNVRIVNKEKDFLFIPELKSNGTNYFLFTHDQIEMAGNYLITNQDSLIGNCSFNFDRSESEMDFHSTRDELENAISKTDIGPQTKILNSGDQAVPISVLEEINQSKYWWYFLLFALILLGLEIILIRIWRTESI